MAEYELRSQGGTESNSAFGSRIILSPSRYRPKRLLFVGACVVFLIGISCLVAALVLITKWSLESSSERPTPSPSPSWPTPSPSCNNVSTATLAPDPCNVSAEALRAGIPQFLEKVTSTYYKLRPHEVRQTELSQTIFRPYNPTLESMKAITAGSEQLLQELRGLAPDRRRLTLREGRLLAQLEHHLQHFFGKPYENNYYSGYWMLGPGADCLSSEPLASRSSGLKRQLNTVRTGFAPKTLQDLEGVLSIIKDFETGIKQRKANIQRGMKVGMVRTIGDCVAGLNCMKHIFAGVGANNSTPLKWLAFFKLDDFLIAATNETAAHWYAKYKKTMRSSLHQALVKHVEEPLAELFDYLGNEHIRHCAPRNATSGLGTSPLKFVYYDGARTGARTNQTLETGDKIISGRDAYKKILSYYTTMDHSPDEVNQTGWTLLQALYPKAVEIAKIITETMNDTEAVAQFKIYLNSSWLYLNKERFPVNESDKGAPQRCRKASEAAVHCPVRYATMRKWLEQTGSVLSLLEPQQASAFHFTGSKRTVPSCPVKVDINFHWKYGVPTYTSARSSTCNSLARYTLPFFVDRMGPVFMEWTVTGHEAFPGHHLQQQGYVENFRYTCDNDFTFLKAPKYPAFTEGWATYAESPLLSHDSDLYNGKPLKRYGMIKSLIWRALRLIIDTGLHSGGMSRDQALQLFAEYLWEESDVMEKEVSQYQSIPGRATSYMIGRQAIWKMRNATEAKLGSKFNLKDFHYHVLRQGAAPLPYIVSYIERYTECVSTQNLPAHSCAEVFDTTAVNRPPSHVNGHARHAEEELTESLDPIIYRF